MNHKFGLILAATFSIIVCTYNPERKIFEPLLNSLSALQLQDIVIEVLIIDNNSEPALADLPYVQQYLKQIANVRILKEAKPGLTAARIAGIKASQNDWFIFFDDDNEPASNYLTEAQKIIEHYPQVGIWGPGCINVKYMSKVDQWMNSNKAIFQERHDFELKWLKEQHWQACYPYGTGMIIRRAIAKEYEKRVNERRYTLSDRKGKSLSSGGDVQMVLTGIQMGYGAGVIPELMLNHLIEAGKTSFSYLKRLIYGTSSAYVKAFNQVFQDNMIPQSAPNNRIVLLIIWHYFKQYCKERDARTQMLKLIGKLGELNARLEYDPKLSKPVTLKMFELTFL